MKADLSTFVDGLVDGAEVTLVRVWFSDGTEAVGYGPLDAIIPGKDVRFGWIIIRDDTHGDNGFPLLFAMDTVTKVKIIRVMDDNEFTKEGK